jgi:hypothetical protein
MIDDTTKKDGVRRKKKDKNPPPPTVVIEGLEDPPQPDWVTMDTGMAPCPPELQHRRRHRPGQPPELTDVI